EVWWIPTPPPLPLTEVFTPGTRWSDTQVAVTYYETCDTGSAGTYPEASCFGRTFFAQQGYFTALSASQASSGCIDGGASALLLQQWDLNMDQPIDGGACY